MSQPNETASDSATSATAGGKLPIFAYLICGWPLLLILIGGAVGGGLAGVAFALNLAIYRGKLHPALKAALIVCSGLAAIFLWLAIGIAFQLTRGAE